MKLAATFRIALRALRRNKMRSVLTMLGIIIGVGAVIAMVGIGNGARAQVETQIASLGKNMILIFSGSTTSSGVRTGWGSAGTLKIEDAEAIAREIPTVASVSPEIRSTAQVAAGNQNWLTQLLGEGPDYFEMRQWEIAAGATFVARTTHTNPNHVLQMMEAAMDHNGFSFIECLSECTEFYPGAFDGTNPRKGGQFPLVPEDHDVTDEYAAYKLAEELMPGKFGILYKVNRPTKNENEGKIVATHREKVAALPDWQILQKNFDRMK